MLVEAGIIKIVKQSIDQNCHDQVMKAQCYLWQIGVNDERPELTDSKDSSESSNQRLCDTRRQEQRDQRCNDRGECHLIDHNGQDGGEKSRR